LIALSSPEIIWTIENGGKVKSLDTWLDFGNIEIYKAALNKSQNYDFTKTDEVTYICNNKVVKWWADESISKKKYDKALANPHVCPSNCLYKGNWMIYDYFQGTVIYEKPSPEILKYLLEWLDEKVWIHSNIDISNHAVEFYKTKTLNRINKFLSKYPDIQEVDSINRVPVKSWHYYLDHVDWELLTQVNLPGFVHGDLQFDNIVISDSDQFCVIDWRHEFADLVETGDIYYDLAKLSGGFIINYSKIKQNDFKIEINDRSVTLEIPSLVDSQKYINIVKEFAKCKGWNYNKVSLLIPLIFWNMSPLHTPPFDKFLWYLGIKLFEELNS
jgi:thiamine kinase-like enzyme